MVNTDSPSLAIGAIGGGVRLGGTEFYAYVGIRGAARRVNYFFFNPLALPARKLVLLVLTMRPKKSQYRTDQDCTARMPKSFATLIKS